MSAYAACATLERVVIKERAEPLLRIFPSEAGHPVDDAARIGVQTWLETPLAALSGLRPVDLIDSDSGYERVKTLFLRAVHSVYT